MSLQQIEFAANALAIEFGESQDTIAQWVGIYNNQTAAAEKYEAEMGNLQAKMKSLETDLNIATKALERMSAAAASSASSLAGSASMKSGQYYNYIYGSMANGSHAGGLDYVPFDGYRAILHKGERVQTAAEAELSRRYENQAPGADIGSAIRAGMGNMQIIWHGRVVADVLSEQQGDSFRALERSGWKS
jgi:hypothetical protein